MQELRPKTWQLFPESKEPGFDLVFACRKHYRKLHAKDGVTLGFRKQGGVTKAYIKYEHI